MAAVIVVGAQWGDEGKGKIIDLLTSQAKYIVRSQGGNNAGHTIVIGNEEYKLHLIPSGILHPHTECFIGAGTVIDPEVLVMEINTLQSRGIDVKNRLWISPSAHVIFPYHRQLDILLEKHKGLNAVGTTGRGIGPAFADKANRLGIRISELMDTNIFSDLLKANLEVKNEELVKLFGSSKLSYEEIFSEYCRYAKSLAPYVTNMEKIISDGIEKGVNVLLEGAQGTFLDINFGTYPYVTSCNTIAGGICTGAGIGPTRITHTLGVIKAYTTRVGLGPLPSSAIDGEDFIDHYTAREFGTTTRRKRRIGWFDAILAKTATRINGLDSMALTKLDVLDHLEKIKILVAYEIGGKRVEELPYLTQELERAKPIFEEMPGWQTDTSKCSEFDDLPRNAKEYIKTIEKLCRVPISIISLGPKREQNIMLKNIFPAKELV